MIRTYSAENIILQKLTGDVSLTEAEAGALKEIINNHPYFGAAYFLLAKKLHHNNDISSETAVQKTALHFTNPLWLNFNLLNDEQQANSPFIKSKTPLTFNESKKEIITSSEEKNKESILSTGKIVQQNVPIKKESEEDELITVSGITKEEEIFFSADDEVAEKQTKEEEGSKLSSILEEQLKEFKKPVDESAEVPIATEPYYRVDYFASQGIKLKPEELGNDELGTRLRSFTGWLKQMKKVAPNPVDLGTSDAEELATQIQADHSNEGGVVYTEAMAEVLVKQGKIAQAIKVYEKLSFSDPAKSFYFAALISKLKQK